MYRLCIAVLCSLILMSGAQFPFFGGYPGNFFHNYNNYYSSITNMYDFMYPNVGSSGYPIRVPNPMAMNGMMGPMGMGPMGMGMGPMGMAANMGQMGMGGFQYPGGAPWGQNNDRNN